MSQEDLSIEALAHLGALRFQVQRLIEAATDGLHDARGLGGAGEFIEHRHYRLYYHYVHVNYFLVH